MRRSGQGGTDFIQGGAGTSTNMNANEVIANLALERLGHKKGEYQHVNPNDHANFGQSTNDVYPTAFRLALIRRLESYAESVAAAIVSMFVGKDLADDPEYQARLRAGKVPPARAPQESEDDHQRHPGEKDEGRRLRGGASGRRSTQRQRYGF